MRKIDCMYSLGVSVSSRRCTNNNMIVVMYTRMGLDSVRLNGTRFATIPIDFKLLKSFWKTFIVVRFQMQLMLFKKINQQLLFFTIFFFFVAKWLFLTSMLNWFLLLDYSLVSMTKDCWWDKKFVGLYTFCLFWIHILRLGHVSQLTGTFDFDQEKKKNRKTLDEIYLFIYFIQHPEVWLHTKCREIVVSLLHI